MKDIFKSKKFISLLIGVAVAIVCSLLELDFQNIVAIEGLFGAHIGWQGLVDMMKEKNKK
jgi:xanthosine utilization system XapX-like protein